MKVPAIATVVLMMSIMTGCSADEDSSASATDDHHHHDHGSGTGTPGSGEFEVAIGAAVSLSGDGETAAYEVTYTVTAISIAEVDDAGEPPHDNDAFIIADVEVRGFRGEHVVGPDNPDYVFSLVDADETEYPLSAQTVTPELSGTVSADQTVTGKLVFDVPAEARETGVVRLVTFANGADLTIDWPYTLP